MDTYIDRTVIGRDGKRIGKVTDVISDTATLEPELVLVKPGVLRDEKPVPIAALHTDGDDLRAPFSSDWVKQAPALETHGTPSAPERAAVYWHYALEVPDPTSGAPLRETG